MDERHEDASTKTRELERLVASGAGAEELFAAATRAQFALDFRAADAAMGLGEVDPRAVEALRNATTRALATAAQAGHVEAALELGKWALATRDEAVAREAVPAMQRFAESEPTGRAHRLLGYLAFHGLACPKSPVVSFEHHRRAASCGDADAMLELYVLLMQGLGTNIDPEEALLWCERAAAAGSARAMANMGGHYAMGRGVEQNDALALTWYERAAEAGHGKAAATLGVMHASGNGAPRDLARARRWFEYAEGLGHDWRSLAESLDVDVGDVFGKPTKRRASAKKKVATKEKKVATRKKKVATKKREVAPKKKAGAPKKRAVAPKKRAVAPKKRAVAPKKRAGAAKKKAVAPKKKVAAKKRR